MWPEHLRCHVKHSLKHMAGRSQADAVELFETHARTLLAQADGLRALSSSLDEDDALPWPASGTSPPRKG